MKIRDDIERLIVGNLNGLNDNEPPKGHFERFEERMQASNRKKKINVFELVWKVAAAAIFGFLIINQAVIWFSAPSGSNIKGSGNQGMKLSEISSEFKEVEFYFTNAINVGLSEWELMMSQGLISKEEQQMLDEELEEFERVYLKLQNDLAISPNDERIISAMLDFYQTKLNLITLIVEKLQEAKQKTNQNHENTY